MKFKPFLISALLVGTLAACGSEDVAKEPKEEEKTDAVAAASITDNPAAFTAALGEDGTWIVAATADITLAEEVLVAGEFYDKDDESQDLYRKLALYTQDEDRNVLDTFTLTVPKMTVESPNFKIQNGTVKGDVFVEANGFSLAPDTTIDGNLYFANEEFQKSAVIEGTVTGANEIKEDTAEETDAVAAASITADPAEFAAALGEDGTWIVAATADITLDEEVLVAGEFYNKDDKSQDLYRKLALYTQDEDRNVQDTFTLTVPKMTVESPNFKIQNGTVKGDVVVEVNGFSLAPDTTIDGNLYFASEEFQKSAVIEGTVTGATEVK